VAVGRATRHDVPVDADLAALADAYGIATDFYDQSGVRHDVSRETVVAVLAALGVVVSDAESIAQARTERAMRDWRRALPPVFVVRAGDDALCWVHVRHGSAVRSWIELEYGGRLADLQQVDRWVDPVDVDGTLVGEATFALPKDLPTGYHRLRVEIGAANEPPAAASTDLIVTPRRIELPERLRTRRGWGFATQLYSMRSKRSWGIGDLGDLSDLASWSGESLGADFVLVNPMHASSPIAPMAPSPYLPVTRRFANPIYLRIEAVPEFAYLDEASRARVLMLADAFMALDSSPELIERDPIWTAKKAALIEVYTVGLSAGRRSEFDAFCVREGSGLDDFALWCALVETHGSLSNWPIDIDDPRADGVAAARVELASTIDFYRWCQWLLDEQFEHAQAAALAAGMAIGVMHDLAVGVHPEGADSWSMRDILATGMSVGAPPDMYNQIGQDWSQPPWRPDSLAEQAFRPYQNMLRTILRHAGGIRVDHVLGLFRLWWIPRGMPAGQGTYVRYDHDALIGILALEAERVGAVVIGEDLGTVEPWVQDVLQERGLLGTSILWFERDAQGQPLPPHDWREWVMASVSTHDLPPTAGFLDGVHVQLRHDLGLLTESFDDELAAHEREKQAWLDVLTRLGLVGAEPSTDDVVEALHRYVARTPARLISISLADAVGDRRTQNQPGTDQEYPNWRVPLTDAKGEVILLDDLGAVPLLQRLVRAVGLDLV